MMKIYTYGALAPTEGRDVLWSQLRKAHNHYNQLIAIERRRRDQYTAARRQYCPDVARLEEKLAAAEAAVVAEKDQAKRERELTGSKRAQPARREAIRVLIDTKKAIGASLKEARERARLHPQLTALSAKIDFQANEDVKKARSDSKVYWPTYNLVADSVHQACQPPKKSAKGGKSDGPHFKAWDTQGRVGGQLMGGAPLAKVYDGSDLRLRIRQLPDDQWSSRKGRRKAYTTVSLRIQSDAESKPVWCTLPIVMHRPLPADADVRYAWVLIRRVGLRHHYYVQLVVSSQEHAVVRMGHGGRVAVDVGWRTLRDGSVRVAYAIDDHGVHQEMGVPKAIVDRLAYASTLHGIADQYFDSAKAELSRLLKMEGAPTHLPPLPVHEDDDDETKARKQQPQPLAELLAGLPQKRSHRKLASVVRRLADMVLGDERKLDLWVAWRKHCKDEKRKLFPLTLDEAQEFSGLTGVELQVWWLDLWRRKDAHLIQWEADQVRHALASRDEMFRIWAAKMAAKYTDLVLEDLDLTELVVVPAPQDGEHELAERARAKHQRAATGIARSALEAAFGPGRIHKEDPQDTTRTCNRCGKICDWDQAQELLHKCEHCGRTWDQDANACYNLLKLASGRPSGAPEAPTARKRQRRKNQASGEEVTSQQSAAAE